MKTNWNIILFIFVLLFVGCYNDNEAGQFSEEFYLHQDGADLPVWVRGNANATTFILFLHGGPFDTGITNAVYNHFESLEEDYAIVYFDQRGGGYSHGEASNLTEEQFVEDVEVVHQLILSKYPQAESFFLMGHSYGGYLGTAFLQKDDNQEDFKGWIELSGAHNFPLNWESSKQYGIQYAQEKIASQIDVPLWTERLNALEEVTSVTNLDELFTVNGIAFAIASDLNPPNNTFENPGLLYVLSSPVGTGFGQNYLDQLENFLVTADQNPNMDRITIPALLIYSEEDPIVPPALGQNAYDFLGTDEENKSLLILEKSGHSLWEYEADIFFQSIKEFVTNYE